VQTKLRIRFRYDIGDRSETCGVGAIRPRGWLGRRRNHFRRILTSGDRSLHAPLLFPDAEHHVLEVVVEVPSIFKQVVFCDYSVDVPFAETNKWAVDAFRDGAL
jgi:hypothetical protein